MKGLELASKVSTKEPYFYGDEHGTHRIAVLDLGIKEIFFAILLKDCYMKIFPFDATYDDLASFSPDGFLVKWPR
jgi:carbamoyl-phosphate synthase small subunit